MFHSKTGVIVPAVQRHISLQSAGTPRLPRENSLSHLGLLTFCHTKLPQPSLPSSVFLGTHHLPLSKTVFLLLLF